MLDFKLQDLGPGAGSKLKPASQAERYDLIIVGGGPAGMSAAVYACRKTLKTLMVTEDLGGQLLLTSGIENYSGFQYITGMELASKFDRQLQQFPMALARPARATGLEIREPGFVLATSTGAKYQGRTVIVASGKRPRLLGVPGEKELSGRGVTYCATCDAPLYAARKAAVVGGGNSALTSLLDLVPLAQTVYAIHRQEDFAGDEVLITKVQAAPNVVALPNREVVRVLGTDRVLAIEVRDRKSGQVEQFEVAGVFVEIGSVANTEFMRDVVPLNEQGEIVVNCRTETPVPGLFSAGDVTNVFEKQIVIAAGEGAKAALAAHAYLLGRRD